jgi:GST-like protein
MTDLSRFAITQKWPPAHPDRLQLYSLPTPNGVKASIMLEELGLPYEVHRIGFEDDDQLSPEYVATFPNNKIPALIDPDGPGGEPLALFESGAILVYLAEKSGRFMPTDPAARYTALQWLMWQMGGIGPMFGQLGFFHKFAGKDFEDKRPRDRYVVESRRLLGVLDGQPEGPQLDARQRLFDRRHRHLPLGAQPGRLLRRRRARRFRRFRRGPACARRLRRPPCGAARPAHPAGAPSTTICTRCWPCHSSRLSR